MKVNFQKICAVITAFSLCVVVCSFPVSAEEYADVAFAKSTAEYLKEVFEVAKSALQNGSITDSDYSNLLQSTNKFVNSAQEVADTVFTGLAQNYSDYITSLGLNPDRNAIDVIVERGRDLLDYCGIDYGKTTATENTIDMKGYGAVYVFTSLESNGSTYYRIYYMDYGLIISDSKHKFFTNDNSKISFETYYSYNTNDIRYNSVDSPYFTSISGLTGVTVYLYGDWRYEDGTSANDKTTPTQNTIQTNDPSTLTDTQLIDLLEDLIMKLKLDFPDLSTIEGLLSAILSQCQSINGKICTSSEIRSMINDAISQIKNGGGGMSAEDIEKITCALDNLKYENNNEQFIADLKVLIGMNGEYDEISKLEVVKSHFYEKAGFITELRNICETAVLAYKNSNNSVSFDLKYNGKSYNINFDFWEQYMPMFRFMLAAVIYLGFAWRTYRKIPFYISGGGDDN